MNRSVAYLVVALALSVAACDDGQDVAADSWQVAQRDLAGAVMSVWAVSATDVWAVGADTGAGPEVHRFDGTAWRRDDTGLSGDLWWVYGFAGGPVFVGGEGGLIARYDGEGFEVMTTPGTETVFGIWGSGPTDMWAVGGNLGGASGAFAWRLDGDEWVEAEGFPAELASTDAVWKVFGRSPTDVWLVGTNGLVFRHDGTEFTREDAGVSTALFTVHGTSDTLMAVGGFGTGVIVERDDAGWRDVTPAGAGQVIGVFAAGDDAYAVGADGAVFRRDRAGAWTAEQTATGTFVPLHAVCIDDRGGVWAVGGQLAVAPFVDGVILYKGEMSVGGEE